MATINDVQGAMKEPIFDDLQSYEESKIGNEAGRLIFTQHVMKDDYGSAIPNDLSLVHLQHKDGSFLSLRGGNIIRKSTSNMVDYSVGDYYQFVGGHAQYVYKGDITVYREGSYSVINGTHTQESLEASQKLQKITTEIDNKGIETIQQNSKNSEKIKCPICANTVDIDRANFMVDTAFKYLSKFFNILPNSPFASLLGKIQAVLRTVLGFFINSMTIAGLTSGGSCGSSGCVKGMISSPLKAIQEGNKASAAEYEKNKKEISKLQKQIPADHGVDVHASDYKIKVGLTTNTSKVISYLDPEPIITELVKATPDWCLIPSSRGSCKRTSYQDPTLLAGSYDLEVGQKYNLTVGSGGISSKTTGKIEAMGSTVVVNASEGELLLTSKNKTIVSGSNVIITARQSDGDAIVLDSDRVFIGGKLSVKADLAVKGSIVMDGGIQCNHIITPIENTQTTVSSSAHNVHSNANWNNPVKPDATKTDLFDKLWKVLRDLVLAITQYIATPDAMKTIFEEAYSTAMISMVIDNTGLPSGFAMIYDYTTYMPITIYGSCSFGGTITGFVTPSMIPVYNYTHNHGSPGDPHSHSYIIPKMLGYDSSRAATASRDEPSVIPTPARATGMGNTINTYPSLGDLGPCGGGGSAFGNAARINSSRLRRNETYGITGDAFNGNDYVNVNVQYNQDGGIIPEPDLNILDC